MMCRPARRIGVSCLVGVFISAPAAPAAEAPSPLALSCTACHQPGVDAAEMPALDRLTPEVIAAALRRSRDAPTPGAIMGRFTARLTDADIEALARELGRTTVR